MVKYKKIFFLLLIAISLLLPIFFVSAQWGTEPAPSSCTGESCTFPNPLDGVSDVPTLAGKIINAVLGIVGSLALVMFIYGGFVWMTASGNQEAVTKGSNILIWAVIGLIVIFTAYTLIRFVFTSLGM